MAVIKVVELVGSSPTGWDDAARNALKEASETIRSIRGLDVINQRNPAGIHWAAEGIEQPWRTKFDRRSNKFTTDWGELPKVK